MKLFHYSAFVFFLLLVADYAGSQDIRKSERIKGWQSDIDGLLSLMKTEHYVYRSGPLPAQLIVKAADLKTKVAGFSDERMLLELERLTWYMHDGHSYILPVARGIQTAYLPIQFYLFNDGVYIIDADEINKNLIGDKVLRVHGVNIDRLINDMKSYVHQDNKYTVKWFAPSMLRFRGIYELYGCAPDAADITVSLVDQNKKRITRKISFVPATDFHGIPKLFPSKLAIKSPAPLYLTNVQDNFWFTHLQNKRKIYFQFNQVEDKENQSLASFGRQLDSVLQKEKPGLLIIDVRHNNGGNLALLQPLIDALKHFEGENPKSKMIVITGRNTFSAA